MYRVLSCLLGYAIMYHICDPVCYPEYLACSYCHFVIDTAVCVFVEKCQKKLTCRRQVFDRLSANQCTNHPGSIGSAVVDISV